MTSFVGFNEPGGLYDADPNYGARETFTASQTGFVWVVVSPYYTSDTGTFAVSVTAQ